MDLEKRHGIEKDFHDAWASSIDVVDIVPRQSFEAETAVENRRILEWAGSLTGKRILDLGCGMGDAAVYFALQGADVDAVDVSPGMVDVCARLAAKEGVSQGVRAAVAVGEGLPFADGTFDIVFGNGVLHHLDLDFAAGEIARILKPGGQGIFIEPLAYNPLIWAYRRLAEGVRTEAEAPLRYGQIRKFGSHFAGQTIEEKQLLTLAIFFWFFFAEWAHPSKVRYWKKIIVESERYAPGFRLLLKAENFLLKWMPFLKPLCWNVLIRVTAPSDKRG